MRDRKKRNIIIGSLCSLLVFMGIGYAVLSQTLNISGTANMKGTWDIKITDISEASRTGKADPGTPTISTNGVSASFEANLWMPGDSITYNITVKNNGNIDAALKELVPSVENGVQQVKFSNNAVQGKVLRQSESYTFQVSVVFDENATEIPQDSKTNPPKYTISLTFVQYTGNSLYTPTNETTDNSCFTIDADGNITNYDKSCGTSITIPNEIDNITVKSVNFDLFNDWDALVGIKTSTSTANIYFKDSKAKLKYEACLASSSNNQIKEFNSSEIGGTVLTNTLSQNTLLMAEKANFTFDETNGIELNPEDTTNIAGEYLVTIEGKDIYSTYVIANDLSIKNKLLKWLENNPTTEKVYVLTKEEASKKQFLTPPDVDVTVYSNFDNCDLSDESGVSLDYLDLSNAKNLKLSSDTFMNAKLGTLILSNPLDSNVGNVFSSSKINKLIVTTDFVNTNNQNYQFNSSEINTAIITGGEDTKLIKKNTGYSIFERSIIKNLIISDGITEIGPAVFNETNIENLRFSGTLKTIGSGAFGRNKLTSLTIPASVETIGGGAFSNNQLTTINFESNSKLKTIDESTFSNNQLTSLTIPSSIETIGNYAFSHNQLTTINFESNSKLKTIGAVAFQYNNLTDVTIPSSVETIDNFAFSYNQLTTINFESNSKLKTIGSYVFGSNQLTNTGLSKLPSSLTRLDTDAFSNNPSLTQITLTSPKDLPGWPNGGTVNGKTVIYER